MTVTVRQRQHPGVTASGCEPARRACIYARVSTTEQDASNQTSALQLVADRAGWEIVGTFVDHGISGAKGRDRRPALDRMLKAAARREFDVVMAWSVDRLGRSLTDLLATLGELDAMGVDLFLDRQGLDTSTPGGRALFQVMGVFAEFERSMIQERVKAGLVRAKARGAKLGRPRLSNRKERAIREARAEGLSVRAIAARCGVSTGSVMNTIRGRVT